jgi:hypothetical protein
MVAWTVCRREGLSGGVNASGLSSSNKDQLAGGASRLAVWETPDVIPRELIPGRTPAKMDFARIWQDERRFANGMAYLR